MTFDEQHKLCSSIYLLLNILHGTTLNLRVGSFLTQTGEFSNSAVDGGQWSDSRPGHFIIWGTPPPVLTV
jgi:hypothetical protein